MAKNPEYKYMFALCQHLLKDENKDVSFKLADGEERAHRVVLMSASEVFSSMFKLSMRESFEKVVELPDVSCVAMRVFLRLLYTGHVDAADWGNAHQSNQNDEVRILRQSNMIVNLPQLSSTGTGDWNSVFLIDCQGGSFDFSIRTNADYAMIGIAPKDSDLPANMHISSGFYAYKAGSRFLWLYAQDGTSHKEIATQWPDSLPPDSVFHVTYDSERSLLSFAVNGSAPVAAQFTSPIPSDVEYCPAVILRAANKRVEILSGPSQCIPCPLDVLLAVAGLAKKYMVKDLMSMVTQALKQRVEQARAQENVRAFEDILAGAIAVDMGAVRMVALRAAEGFAALRKSYDGEELKPEVAYELEAIWPASTGRAAKAIRLT